MKTQQIRQLINKAFIEEKQTNLFSSLLANYFKSLNKVVTDVQLEAVKTVVKSYVEHVPDLLDSAEKTSKANGCWNFISPMLESVQQYFLNPDDLIPDSYGMIGLMDDAYLSHILLQTLSEKLRAETGKQLITSDWTIQNNIIRNLLGMQNALILENQVYNLVNGSAMQNVLQQLIAMAGSTNYSLPDTSFGGLSASEYANFQTELITSSYSPSW